MKLILDLLAQTPTLHTDLSAEACKVLGLRRIKQKQWVTVPRVYDFFGGKRAFDLVNLDHLDYIEDGNTRFYHPDQLVEEAKRFFTVFVSVQLEASLQGRSYTQMKTLAALLARKAAAS